MPEHVRSLSQHTHLSPRQLRAVRKELLVARASLERMNLSAAQADLSRHISRFGWLGFVIPGFSRRADTQNAQSLISQLPPFLQPALAAVIPLLRRHPVTAAMLSLALGLPSGERLRKAGGSAKWAGGALLGIRAFRLIRRFTAWRRTRKAAKR